MRDKIKKERKKEQRGPATPREEKKERREIAERERERELTLVF